MDQPHISGEAVIITGGLLTNSFAKTAHGLLRFSERFKITGVIDDRYEGQDPGEVLFSKKNGIPIISSIEKYCQKYEKPEYAIIGMATKGGRVSDELKPHIKAALKEGIHIINGLHQPLNSFEDLSELAYEHGAIMYDIRQPKPFEEMHFWKGEKILEIDSLVIPVLGVDCAVGKRTTSQLLVQELNKSGLKAEMIYTGQTGWMQGGHYGFLFDATPNDFIPGEIEFWLHKCWEERKSDVMIIEGQSGLRNPSGPCGLEFLLSGKASGFILQSKPSVRKYKGLDNYPVDLPHILDEAELLEKFGVPLIGLAISSEGLSHDEASDYRKNVQSNTDLPVVLPVFESLQKFVDAIKKLRN
jgi:uncharacterized NAD-dependent epimerase/dehydratase family protein